MLSSVSTQLTQPQAGQRRPRVPKGICAISPPYPEQLSASIDTYPETFGNVHVDKVVFSGVGGIGADRAQIGLVIDITGHAEYFLDNRFDGNAVHGGNGRADNLFRGFIENPGNADAYAEILRVWEIGAQLTKHGVRILDNLPYSVAERYIVPFAKKDLIVQVEDRKLHQALPL
mgnify:CR=1 FL=1